jgi:hypothetical protein
MGHCCCAGGEHLVMDQGAPTGASASHGTALYCLVLLLVVLPQKLLAFEKFLEEHPEWRDKVLLVQIAVPSRTDVPEYQRLRR